MKSGSSNVSNVDLASIRSPDGSKKWRFGPSRDHAAIASETFHTVSKRLYEKLSSTSQPPQHEATHGSVHECFAART
jgi:hypothetical protein